MGIFDSLFGRSKKTSITATRELMPSDQFWEIIQSAFDDADGAFELQQEALKQALRKLNPQSILLFDNRFRQLRGNAYDWKLWGAAYIINGGCSDDCFTDFRDWVIAQGKEFYYKTLLDPASLVEVEKDTIGIDWEGMGYIATEVYEELTGVEMPDGFIENTDIKGEEWSEENDDLENMFPMLWAKYDEQ